MKFTINSLALIFGLLLFNVANAESPREQLRQMVSIPGKNYELGKYLVTQGQWKAVMGNNPSNFSNCGDACPVEQVSWNDAQEFIQKLNAKTGKQYRLPNEAEWEYAAAAGTNTFYWWGNNSGENRAACFNCGSRWDGRETAPVGSFAANAFGLYDTAGNVLEWVADCRHESYQDAPADGDVWAGGDCSRHIARGGGFDSPVDNLRTQSRPYFAGGTRLNNLGLRVVRED